ncbi:MAG: signal peptidase I, partial [Actinomycetes bacterium]
MTTEDGARSAGALPVPSAPPPSAADPHETERVTRVSADEQPEHAGQSGQAGGGPEPSPATHNGQVPGPPAARSEQTTPGPPAAARPASSRPAPSRQAKPRKKSFLRELPGIVGTALIISVLIKTFLVQAFYIPSGSMENTLLVNDRVLVNKLADKPDEIHRGDVVVFRDPGGWLGGSDVQARG